MLRASKHSPSPHGRGPSLLLAAALLVAAGDATESDALVAPPAVAPVLPPAATDPPTLTDNETAAPADDDTLADLGGMPAIWRRNDGILLEDIPLIPERVYRQRWTYERIGRATSPRWMADGGMLYDLQPLDEGDGSRLQLAHIDRFNGDTDLITLDGEFIVYDSIRPHPLRNGFLYIRWRALNEQELAEELARAEEQARTDDGSADALDNVEAGTETDDDARAAAAESSLGDAPSDPRGVLELLWHDLELDSSLVLADHLAPNARPIFTRDGRCALFSREKPGSEEQTSPRSELFIVPLSAPFDFKPVPADVDFLHPRAWFPDGRRLLVQHPYHLDTWVSILDTETGELHPLESVGDPHFSHQAVPSPDGTRVYFVSTRDARQRRLWEYDILTGKRRAVSADIPWDVDTFALSPDGRHLALSVNEDGYGVLHAFDLETGNPLPVPPLPEGVVGDLSFHPFTSELAVTVDAPMAPADVWSINLRTTTRRRWTETDLDGLTPDDFIAPELVSFPTYDSDGDAPRQIPAFVCKPEGMGPFAVLITLHGGPEAQYRPYFSSGVQHLVNALGVAVVAPNVRGSSGYGAGYASLDDRQRRGTAIKDIGALLDWIETRPDLDARRVAVSGADYGGWLALASLDRYGDRLLGGIAVRPITDWTTYLAKSDVKERRILRHEFGDLDTPQLRLELERLSPLPKAHRLQRPLLLAADDTDPRRPATEVRMLAKRVRRNDATVWLMLAEDERGVFERERNKPLLGVVTTQFLKHVLLGNGDPGPESAPVAATPEPLTPTIPPTEAPPVAASLLADSGGG